MPWKIKPAFRPAFSMEMPEAFKQPLAGVPNCHCLPPQRGKAVHAVHATNSVIMSTHRQGTHTDCLQQHPPAIKTIKLLQSCSGDSLTHSLTLRVSGKKNIFSTSYCTHVQPHKPEHTQLFVLHFLTNVAYSNFFFYKNFALSEHVCSHLWILSFILFPQTFTSTPQTWSITSYKVSMLN